jgi:NAD(P) transhydrogenase
MSTHHYDSLVVGSSNAPKYFVKTTLNYPTMAEVYRVVALKGLNRVFSGW